MPTRILFIDLAPVAGGSIISLYHLVRGLQALQQGSEATSNTPSALHPSSSIRYEPVLLLAEQNAYVPRFRALGVEVHTRVSRQGQGDIHGVQVERVRRGRVAEWIRTQPVAAEPWHAAGFWLRFLRRILPEARQLAHFMRQHDIAAVHNNDTVSVSRAGVIAGHWAQRPVICHVRSFEEAQRFPRWLSRWVDAYIFISEAVQHNLQNLGYRLRHSFVIPNGVDLSEFPATGTKDEGRRTEDARQRLDDTTNRPMIGSIGRLVDWKGHDVFLRALAEVRRELPQVRGLIVGDGEPSEPDYPAYLRKLTRELGLGGAVTFTGHRSDVPQLLGGMRVFVHAAKAPEPFGRVIIESMAARCPVVATAAGGVPEIVQEGVTGCLVPAGDVKATAAAVTRLLTHPESARQMAQRARQSVEQRFTVQHTLEGILRVYDEVLA